MKQVQTFQHHHGFTMTRNVTEQKFASKLDQFQRDVVRNDSRKKHVLVDLSVNFNQPPVKQQVKCRNIKKFNQHALQKFATEQKPSTQAAQLNKQSYSQKSLQNFASANSMIPSDSNHQVQLDETIQIFNNPENRRISAQNREFIKTRVENIVKEIQIQKENFFQHDQTNLQEHAQRLQDNFPQVRKNRSSIFDIQNDDLLAIQKNDTFNGSSAFQRENNLLLQPGIVKVLIKDQEVQTTPLQADPQLTLLELSIENLQLQNIELLNKLCTVCKESKEKENENVKLKSQIIKLEVQLQEARERNNHQQVTAQSTNMTSIKNAQFSIRDKQQPQIVNSRTIAGEKAKQSRGNSKIEVLSPKIASFIVQSPFKSPRSKQQVARSKPDSSKVNVQQLSNVITQSIKKVQSSAKKSSVQSRNEPPNKFNTYSNQQSKVLKFQRPPSEANQIYATTEDKATIRSTNSIEQSYNFSPNNQSQERQNFSISNMSVLSVEAKSPSQLSSSKRHLFQKASVILKQRHSSKGDTLSKKNEDDFQDLKMSTDEFYRSLIQYECNQSLKSHLPKQLQQSSQKTLQSNFKEQLSKPYDDASSNNEQLQYQSLNTIKPVLQSTQKTSNQYYSQRKQKFVNEVKEKRQKLSKSPESDRHYHHQTLSKAQSFAEIIHTHQQVMHEYTGINGRLRELQGKKVKDDDIPETLQISLTPLPKQEKLIL